MDSMKSEMNEHQAIDQNIADITAILSGNETKKSTPKKENAKVVETEEAPEESEEVDETETEHDDVEEEVEETDEEESPADDEEIEDDETSHDDVEDDDSEVSVMIGGEKTKVKLGELKNGYMRQQNYTKKTQELANTRKELESELNTAIERGEAVQFNAVNQMKKFQEALDTFGGWQGLQSNPDISPEQYEQFKHQYQMIQRDYNMANSIVEESRETYRKNATEAINGIFKELNNTRSDFKGDETIGKISSYLEGKGFTQDMVLGMTQLGMWEIVLDALAYNTVKTKAKTTEANVAKKAKSLPNSKKTSETKKDKDYKTNLKRMQSDNPDEARAAGAALIKKLL